MNWDKLQTLMDAKFVSGSLVITIGPLVLCVILGLIVYSLVARKRLFFGFQVEPVRFTILGTSWDIKRGRATAKLAHEAYVELTTRKAALPFDEAHDTITEIYNSWYAVFGDVRGLARRLDPTAIATDSDLQKLNELLIAILNDGLRPHLTVWQAKFRRWYETEAASRPGESPQAIQRDYPDYAELVSDLKATNTTLLKLAEGLRRLAYG